MLNFRHFFEKPWPPNINRSTYLLLWLLYFAAQMAYTWWVFGLTEITKEQFARMAWGTGLSTLATFFIVALKKKDFGWEALGRYALAAVMVLWPIQLFILLMAQIEWWPFVLAMIALPLLLICPIWLIFTQNRLIIWLCCGFIGFIMPILLVSGMVGLANLGEKIGKASVHQGTTLPPRSASGLFTSEYGKLTHENITVIVRGGQLEQPTEITISKEPFTPSDFEKTAGAWRLLEKFTVRNNTGKVRNAQAEIIVKMDLKEELKENEEPRVELAFRADGSEKSQMVPYIGPILEDLGDGVYSFETNLSESETPYGKGTHIVYYLYASPK